MRTQTPTTPPPPPRRRRRLVLPVVLAGSVASLILALGLSPTVAAFTAQIQNTVDTAGSGTLIMQETVTTSTGSTITCKSTDSTTIDMNSATCTPINKYGGTMTMTATWAAFALPGGLLHEPDLSGNGHHGVWARASTPSGDIGCARDTPASSVLFSGGQCLYVPSWQHNPNVFALEAWFSTTTAPSGKIIGFGDGFLTPDDPSHWDRHVYLDDSGRVVFGLFSNGFVTLASPAGTSYADGKWHSVIANLSGAGAQLYVDGVLVDANPSVTTAQNYGGYWRVGCGRLTYGSSAPSTFTGRIQYAAIYGRPLTAMEAQQHAAAGR